MKTIRILDMSLRETSPVRETALSFKERLEIARILDRLKVDVIELPEQSGGKADLLSNKTIAASVKTGLSASVHITEGNIEETWDSICHALQPSLNLITPVSIVQMEYACHKKGPAMLQLIGERVKACRALCERVEFTAFDATRAEKDFLYEAIATAIDAGADRVTLCDTAGIMLPDEFASFIRDLKEHVPSLEGKQIFVQVSDAMSMGAACAAFAIAAGVDGVKCTALPAGFVTLEEMVRLIQTRGTDLGIDTGIRTTEISRAVTQLGWILESGDRKDNLLGNIGLGAVETAGVTLTANDDINEVIKVVRRLGYDLSEEDNAKVYEAFRRVAEKKQFVGTKELDAIVASSALQVPSTYRIENYVINSGNVITATANILLDKDGKKLRGIGCGDGPIDAAFLAIEQIIGHHYELDDFQIKTVSQGRDVMCSALVKL